MSKDAALRHTVAFVCVFLMGVGSASAPAQPATVLRNATLIDCTGKTIIPGLISAHSHLGVLENNAENTAAAYNLPNVGPRTAEEARQEVDTLAADRADLQKIAAIYHRGRLVPNPAPKD